MKLNRHLAGLLAALALPFGQLAPVAYVAPVVVAVAALSPDVATSADTTLSPSTLVQIEEGASEDTWGLKLNNNASIINAWFSAGPALKVANGGTGSTTASGARTNLGLGTAAVVDATVGTYSAVFSASTTPPTGVTYSANTFTYIKIGRLVVVNGVLTLTSKGTGGVSNVTISLPFAAQDVGAASVRASGYTLAAGVVPNARFTGSTIVLTSESGTTVGGLNWADVSDTFSVFVSLAYIATS